MFRSIRAFRKIWEGKFMSVSFGDRVEIVPVGELHFEVRFFADAKDKRYRSWCLPLFEAAWMERRFRGILVAPLIYDVKDSSLYQMVRPP
jgi:hypothetical protein